MRGVVVASHYVRASPARTNGQFETRCISGKSVHLQPFNPIKGYRKLCVAGSVGLVSALPASDGRRHLPHSNARHPDSMKCAATANATMAASGQTQTLPRGNTATKAPVKDKVKVPMLDDGGSIPPGRDRSGGGGGGGGGGGNTTGGFILFGFLLLMSFLKDAEKSWIARRSSNRTLDEIEDDQY